MFGKRIATLIVSGALLASGAVWAEPSIDQVYQAAKAGNYSQAQSMMDEVLRAHPNSAKAHFVEAELLAKQGKFNAARSELDTAQKLDPSQSFAKPGALQELKSTISATGNALPRQAGGGIHVPWGPLLLILAVFVVVLMVLRARSRRAYDPGAAAAGGWRPAPGPIPGMPGGGPGMPAGYGPGAAPMAPPAGGGLGSGILGGLATGAAVGAGMVAGEALAHRVLGDGASHSANSAPVNSPLTDPNAYVQTQDANYDMGGNDFGVNDASSWGDSSSGGGDSGGGWDDSSGGGSDDWS